jgi:REP element-mobilizing transposase RayT
MPRGRRYFESGNLYEVTFRATEGLPLPARPIIETLIKSALARAQRDQKVTLVDFVWMGNHAHLLVIAWDAKQATDFYAEIQKNLSEYLKRLHGLDRLSLWEGRPNVALVPDLKSAMARKVYFYLNPVRANLVDSINKYPGYSSFKGFCSKKNSLLLRVSERVPFIRQSAVPKSPVNDLTIRQERALLTKMLKRSQRHHRVNFFPNLWAAVFGVTEPEEIAALNAEIMQEVESVEKFMRAERLEKGGRVMGQERLLLQPLMQPHTPKTRSRKVFVICGDKELRLVIIKAKREIEDLCEQCYQRWKRGDYSAEWPPGTFRPPMPPTANTVRFQ